MEIIIVFITLGVLLLFGVPIFISILLTSFVGTIFFTDIMPTVLVQRSFAGIDKFVLMALPFFILGANAVDVVCLSKRLITLARALLGHMYGGMAITTQVAATMFGALSGSGPASVAGVGRIIYPELIRSGYDKKWASGLIIQSGSVSLLIPPSISLLVFATVTNISVADIFMAGLGAGLVFSLVTLAYIYLYARKNNIRGDRKASKKDVFTALKDASWSLLVPVIIVGGIFSGFFTPTEAAAVGAIYSVLIGMFIYKEITFKKLYELCLSSAKTTAVLLVIIAVSMSFSWLLSILQFPVILADFLNNNFTSMIMFLLFLNVILLILGMFLDPTMALIVISPLVLPTAVELSIDPIHLGVIVCFNLAIGQFTPPFGLNIFVGQSITRLDLYETWKGLPVFIFVALVSLILVTYIPQISLFIPNLL